MSKATRTNVPEIPEAERRGPDGKRADAVTIGGGLVFGHPRLGDDPMVTFDTTIVHAFHRDHRYNALEDAEKLKYDKYLDPYAASRLPPWPPRQLVSWVQTCCGFFGSALSLRWAGLKRRGLMARFLLRHMALAPMCWRRRRDGASCFRR